MPTAAARVDSLRQAASFPPSLRAPTLQAGEFRLHLRSALPIDGLAVDSRCAIGFVLPKRLCKPAVRRNLIRRVMRDALLRWLRASAYDGPPLVLVLRLGRAFPASYRSAASPQLRQLLRDQARQLCDALDRRIGAR